MSVQADMGVAYNSDKPPQKTKKRHAITYSAVRQAGEKRPRRKQ